MWKKKEQYYVVGTGTGAGTYECHLKKYDDSGNLIWDKIVTSIDKQITSLALTSDGGFIIGGMWFGTEVNVMLNGAEKHLIKFNNSGNVIWDKKISSDEAITSLVQTSDGGYALGAGTHLIKCDSSGNILWDKEAISAGEINAIFQTSDGGCVVGTTIDADLIEGHLIKFNNSGNVIWDKKISSNKSITSLAQTSDGGYVLGVGTHLIKCDSSGNILWDKELSILTGSVFNILSISSVTQTSDGGYALGAYYSAGDSYLIKCNSDGNVIWKKGLSIGIHSHNVISVIQTSDNGYIVGTEGSVLQATEGFLIKYDSSGNELWRKTIPELSTVISIFE